MARSIVAPKDVHILVPESCEFGISAGSRDFADVKDVEMEIILDYMGGPNVLTRVLMSKRGIDGRVRVSVREKDGRTEAEFGVMQ